MFYVFSWDCKVVMLVCSCVIEMCFVVVKVFVILVLLIVTVGFSFMVRYFWIMFCLLVGVWVVVCMFL